MDVQFTKHILSKMLKLQVPQSKMDVPKIGSHM